MKNISKHEIFDKNQWIKAAYTKSSFACTVYGLLYLIETDHGDCTKTKVENVQSPTLTNRTI